MKVERTSATVSPSRTAPSRITENTTAAVQRDSLAPTQGIAENEAAKPDKEGASISETETDTLKEDQRSTRQPRSKRSRRRNRRGGFKPKRRRRPSRMFAGGSR